MNAKKYSKKIFAMKWWKLELKGMKYCSKSARSAFKAQFNIYLTIIYQWKFKSLM